MLAASRTASTTAGALFHRPICFQHNGYTRRKSPKRRKRDELVRHRATGTSLVNRGSEPLPEAVLEHARIRVKCAPQNYDRIRSDLPRLKRAIDVAELAFILQVHDEVPRLGVIGRLAFGLVITVS